MNNKFRVWCKNKNQWETDYCVLTSDGVLLHRVRNMWVPLNRDAHIVVFSTGLNDKNGKEIFESDIVKAKDHEPSTYRIEFIDGGYCLTNPKLEGYPLDINILYPSIGCQIEVIGNTYDNPEFLEVANGQH